MPGAVSSITMRSRERRGLPSQAVGTRTGPRRVQLPHAPAGGGDGVQVWRRYYRRARPITHAITANQPRPTRIAPAQINTQPHHGPAAAQVKSNAACSVTVNRRG